MKITLLANILAKHPKIVILLFTFFTVLIGIQAQNIFMLADYTEFLPEDDASLILWDRINEEFNLGSTIIILVNQTDRAHNDVRDPEVLKEMDKVYRVLYENPITDGKKTEISSIISLSILIRAENAEAKPRGNNDDSIPEEEDAHKINEYMERFEIKRCEL